MNVTAKKIFILDGAGALLSALFLGVILPAGQSYFGIPLEVLRVLAIFPVGFALFDTSCYFASPKNDARNLRIIAGLNLVYCALSLWLAAYHWERLTYLGWLYMAGEVAIVLVIVRMELRIAARLSNQADK